MNQTIIGIGIDLIEVERIEHSIQKFGDAFLLRLFLPREIDYCRQHRNPNPHFAARFAAKEAISKCLGTGISQQLTWKDMEIYNQPSGSPDVRFHEKGLQLIEELNALKVLISLSHTHTHAIAQAILIGQDS